MIFICILNVLAAFASAEDPDYGNDPNFAFPIEPNGSYIEGILSSASDQDWFWFSSPANGLYDLTIHSSSGSKYVVVYGLNDSGQLQSITSFAATSGTVTNRIFIPRSGTTWLKVYNNSGSGAYYVSINFLASFAADTYPNLCTSPAPLSVGSPPLYDGITEQPLPGKDEDWFSFSTAALHKYQATLTRAQNTDIRFDLYNTNCGSSLWPNVSTMTLVSWDANDYCLRVHDYAFDANGYYELSVTDLGLQADDFGNSSASAAPVEPNGWYLNGSLQYTADIGSDQDWFAFTAVAYGLYEVSLNSPSGTKSIAVFEVNDSNVPRQIANFSASGGTVTNDVFVSRPGATFLKIYNGSGTYNVAVNFVAAFPADAYSNWCTQAANIEVNASPLYDSIIGQGADEDWFTFNSSLLHKYQLTLTQPVNTNVRFDLDNNDCGSTLLTNKSTATLVSWDANAYDIRVYDFGFDADGYFELSITDLGQQSDDYSNISASAESMNPNGQDVNGSIQYSADTGSDEDWLKFSAVAGSYQVKLYSQAGRRDIALYQLNDSNQLQLITSFFTSTTITNNVSIPREGTVWLRIFSPSSSGLYQFSVLAPVQTCGDINHPFPPGDLNQDCLVDFLDFSTLANSWLFDSRP